MQECCANEDIPVQFCSSQLIVSMATPVQFSPPLLASCSKTRVRVCSPAPQSLEQFDHSLHADHKQSTTTFNTRMTSHHRHRIMTLKMLKGVIRGEPGHGCWLQDSMSTSPSSQSTPLMVGSVKLRTRIRKPTCPHV